MESIKKKRALGKIRSPQTHSLKILNSVAPTLSSPTLQMEAPLVEW